MASTTSGRAGVADNNVRLERSGQQTAVTEKQSSRKRYCIQFLLLIIPVS